MGDMNKSDEVIVLRYLESTMVTPSTEDVEAILRKHPDDVWDVLQSLKAKELVWSEESDWWFGTSWGLTALGAATCLFLKEFGAKNLDILKDEIEMIRRNIREGKTTGTGREGGAVAPRGEGVQRHGEKGHSSGGDAE